MKKHRRSIAVVIGIISVLLGAGLLSRVVAGEAGTGASADSSSKVVPVITESPVEMEFLDAVVVAGDVEAARYALVSARVPGTLDEVLVDEGDRVVAGETILFRTDSANLGRAVEIARHDVDVAGCSLREAEANLTQLEARHAQVLADVGRYRRLREKGAATEHQLELMETQYREAEATLEYAQAVIDLARARQSQSASRLAMAEKDLNDSVVLAPIDGRVVARLREPGEMASAGTPVLRIEDHRGLDLVAFVPEEHFSRVVPGVTEVRASAGGLDLGRLQVTFRGPVVHRTLRNFEIKARVATPPDGLVPGRLVDLVVVLESRQGVGVPRSAVLVRGGKTVVFIAEGEIARMHEVVLGLPTDGHVEVVGSDFPAGAEIVVEGQTWLTDGTRVVRVKED